MLSGSAMPTSDRNHGPLAVPAAAACAAPGPAQAASEGVDSPLRDYVPADLLAETWWGVEVWQWLALAAVIAIGIVVGHLVRFALAPLLRALIRRLRTKAPIESQRRLLRPLGLTARGVTWLLLLALIGFEGDVESVLLAACRAFTVLAGTWTAWRLVDLVADAAVEYSERTANTLDNVLVPLLGKTAKTFIVAFGLIYTAQSLHVNVVPLITGLGIGGLAFAFAAKDTVENLFGSVAVILDRPFEIGDWVEIGDVEGTVEDLGFRSTRVRTFYNSQVTVPNSHLVSATVDNYGRRRYRRWKTTLGIEYGTPPTQVLAFTEGIRALVRHHPHTRKDYYQVWANDFNASSIDVLLYVFFEVPDWSTELRERERLLVDIMRLAESLGVGFAFPTRSVHLIQDGDARPDEDAGQAGSGRPAGSTDEEALRSGAAAAERLVELQPWRKQPPGPVTFPAPTSPRRAGDPLEATEDRGATPS